MTWRLITLNYTEKILVFCAADELQLFLNLYNLIWDFSVNVFAMLIFGTFYGWYFKKPMIKFFRV